MGCDSWVYGCDENAAPNIWLGAFIFKPKLTNINIYLYNYIFNTYKVCMVLGTALSKLPLELRCLKLNQIPSILGYLVPSSGMALNCKDRACRVRHFKSERKHDLIFKDNILFVSQLVFLQTVCLKYWTNSKSSFVRVFFFFTALAGMLGQ